MKKQIKVSVILGFSLLLSTGFSALQAWDSWLGDNEKCRWNCCNDGCHLNPAQPCCSTGGFFVGADFIYWAPWRINNDFAVDGTRVVVGEITTNIPDGNFHHVHHRWQPGFKVELGYIWGCDGWDNRVIWTHLHSHNSNSTSPGEGAAFLIPTLWPHNIFLADANIASFADASESMKYDVVDFLFEHPFFVSCTHTLKPFFGVRGLWLHQNLDVSYTGGSGPGGTAFGTRVGSVSWDSKFEGAGLIAGLSYEMLICDCLSLYADFSGSLLAGQHRNSYNATLFATPTATVGTTVEDISERENSLLPGYHVGTGLTWETNVCNNCLVINLGYEFNQWFNTHDPRRFSSEAERGTSFSNSDGSLLLHGLTVGADIYF